MAVVLVDGTEYNLDDDVYVNNPQKDITKLTHEDLDIYGKYISG